MDRSLLWKGLQAICRIVTTLEFDLKAYGLENVPRTGGCLLVANHQSYLDPVLVAVRLYRPVSFFAKSELFENPFFGWLIRSLHAFPVRQGEGDVGAVRETIRRLHEGHILNLYPEGSRTDDGEIAPIQKGIALILRKVEVPVVPVAIDGSYESWPKSHKLFRPYPIRVMYGPPMELKGLKGDAIVQAIGTTLKAMLAELREMRKAEEASRGFSL